MRSSVFEPLAPGGSAAPPEAISMNYGMTPKDDRPRDPIAVYDFNKQPEETSRCTTRSRRRPGVAPCHDTMPAIGGWVCNAE